MRLSVFKSKIHRATVTGQTSTTKARSRSTPISWKGRHHRTSRCRFLNVNNGERFDTYAIRGTRGSVICLNGPRGHRLAHVGDLVIILTFAWMERDELERGTPRASSWSTSATARFEPWRRPRPPARSVRKPRRLAAVKLRIAGRADPGARGFFPAIASTQESRPGVPRPSTPEAETGTATPGKSKPEVDVLTIDGAHPADHRGPRRALHRRRRAPGTGSARHPARHARQARHQHARDHQAHPGRARSIIVYVAPSGAAPPARGPSSPWPPTWRRCRRGRRSARRRPSTSARAATAPLAMKAQRRRLLHPLARGAARTERGVERKAVREGSLRRATRW